MMHRRKIQIEDGSWVWSDGEPRDGDLHYVTAVLAASKIEGEKLAEAIGLIEYRVITNPHEAQGLRIRGFIITPEYFSKVERAHYNYNAMIPFDTLIHNAVISGAPLG